MKKGFLLFLRIIVGIVILAFLMYKLNLAEIYDALLKINLIAIFLLLCHYSTTVLFNVIILGKLSKSLKLKVGFFDLLKKYALSYSLGRFTPGRIGDFSLIYLLGKKKENYGKTAAITVILKMIIFVSLVFVGILGFFAFFKTSQIIKIVLVLLAIVVLAISFVFSHIGRNLLKRFVFKKHASKFAGFSENIAYLFKNKKSAILLCFLLLLIRFFLSAFIVYLIFRTFDISVSILSILFINILGVLIALIPISISGLGTREYASVLLYSRIGVSAVISGTIYLLVAFSYFLFCGIILLIYVKEFSKREK